MNKILQKIMGLRHTFQDSVQFHSVFDHEGINWTLPLEDLATAKLLRHHDLINTQLIFLQQLNEEGLAETLPNGFCISPETFYENQEEIEALFELPEQFTGSVIIKTQGTLKSSGFEVNALLRLDGREINQYSFVGPCVRIGTKYYLLRKQDFFLLKTVRSHTSQNQVAKSEAANIKIVHTLKLLNLTYNMGLDLRHFNKMQIHEPSGIQAVLDIRLDGSGVLSPSFSDGLTATEHEAYLAQIDPSRTQGSLRIGDNCILLNEKNYAATKEIIANRNLSPEAVVQFIKTPSAYLDAKLVDLDNGFSLRVLGVTEYRQAYFGFQTESTTDWFAREQEKSILTLDKLRTIAPDLQSLDSLESLIDNGRKSGAPEILYNNDAIDVTDGEIDSIIAQHKHQLHNPRSAYIQNDDEDKLDQLDTKVVVNVAQNDVKLDFSISTDLKGDIPEYVIDLANLKRQPFPHQSTGISWIQHLHAQGQASIDTGSGGILADDMGLGKTYMALVGIAEIIRKQRHSGLTRKPTLIVAPVSLLENWGNEIEKTFFKSPFNDVVVLQADADLKKYKHKGSGRETKQNASATSDLAKIKYSLKIGGVEGMDRLDMPGRLVLTNYQTLADYQISLCQIDWGVVVFDEAQNVKNPNAMVTIASKGLKAELKIMATGTPVENGLQDFWCLMDTAAPGLLGNWVEFRDNFVTPMNKAEHYGDKKAIGDQIREKIGIAMLRRIKEDHIEGLPNKTIQIGDATIDGKNFNFAPEMKVELKGSQLEAYDEVVNEVLRCPSDEKHKLVLNALYKLRGISMHTESILKSSSAGWLERSVKTSVMLYILERKIKPKDEKVIIFLTNKALQALLKLHLSNRYDLDIQIINGDAKAVANKGSSLSRQGMIDVFQAEKGFGIIIMSPVAAGVGLTVTAANHVIHFEREWNPAKEAQATDRVYRIGQTKDVHVWIPIVHHPQKPSFELNLHHLLARKSALSSAILVPGNVDKSELESTTFS
jgi:SNF2 family DNA or RNA helicase